MSGAAERLVQWIAAAAALSLLPCIAAAQPESAGGRLEACRARACLESPYGPGMSPGCAELIAGLQERIVAGGGLPVCAADGGQADYSTGLYWRAMGWRECAGEDLRGGNPFSCGTHVHESLPVLIAFEPGSAAALTAEGERTLAALSAAVRSRPFTMIRLVGVWESRAGYADGGLALGRAQVVHAGLGDMPAGMAVSLESGVSNYVAGRGLRHGVWVSAAGSGVRPDRTLLGERAETVGECGVWNAAEGSFRAIVEAALRACGLQLRNWVEREGRQVDFRLTTSGTKRVGESPEQLLEFLGEQFGLSGRIDDIDVDFTRSVAERRSE